MSMECVGGSPVLPEVELLSEVGLLFLMCKFYLR